MNADRPHKNAGIEQLEGLVQKKKLDLSELRSVRIELKQYRRSRRAKELLRSIEQLLDEATRPIRDVRARIERTKLRQASSPDWVKALYNLDPEYFERVVIGAFKKVLGFDLQPTPRTSDGGVDGVGQDPFLRKTVLQAKRWKPSSTIGPDEIRAFVGAMVEQHHPELGIFATTARFTDGVEKIAERRGIILFDGTRLSQVMESAKLRYDLLKYTRSTRNPLSPPLDEKSDIIS